MNGPAVERNLARTMYAAGFAVIRAPSSGSATDRPLPDLLAARDDVRPMAIEVKTTSKANAYVDPDKMDSLVWVAEQFGGRAFVACRFSQDTTAYFVSPSQMHRTDTGNYAIGRSGAKKSAWVEFEAKS